MSKAVIVIPARYGSSRLPGKPLLDIVGKPMIQHVYERALQVAGVAEVWVATDDQRVEKAVQAFGGKAIMTRNDHESGTDRLVEVMHKVEADIYINLQGDEPMIRPRDVETLLQGMRDDPALPVATIAAAAGQSQVRMNAENHLPFAITAVIFVALRLAIAVLPLHPIPRKPSPQYNGVNNSVCLLRYARKVSGLPTSTALSLAPINNHYAVADVDVVIAAIAAR